MSCTVCRFFVASIAVRGALFVSQVRAKIVRGEYDMPDVLFQHLPAEAKDFISRLLVVDQKERMSAETALAHPWLRRSSR